MVPPKPTARERELFEQLATVSTFDPRRTMTAPRYVLARRPGMQLDDFTTRCGLHPDMVRRLVAPASSLAGRMPAAMRFEPSALVTVGRIQRLRTSLGLNYAAIGLVLDLLDHIEELESASGRRRTSPWTSTS